MLLHNVEFWRMPDGTMKLTANEFKKDGESMVDPRIEIVKPRNLEQNLVLALGNRMIGQDYPNVGEIVDIVLPLVEKEFRERNDN